MNERSVCIIGATGGIGSAITRRFKNDVYSHLILMDLPGNSLKSLAAEVGGHAVEIDLSKPDSIRDAFKLAQSMIKSVDVLLLVSGVVENRSLPNVDIGFWNQTLAINLSGFFLCAQAAEGWITDGGRIITLGSMAGHQGSMITGPAYAASKGGVEGLTKYLARYFASRRITANCITPGPVDTPMLDAHDPGLLDAARTSIPLLRFAEAEEIAAAALYLASQDAGYTTGSVLSVNGGTRME